MLSLDEDDSSSSSSISSSDHGSPKPDVRTRRRKRQSLFYSVLLKPLLQALQAIFQIMISSVAWGMGAAEDVARFAFILFGVIPWLACMFVVLGITFHIPRIFLTYACRPAVWFCWRHVSACKRRGRSVLSGRRKTDTNSCCLGSCCSVCWLAVWMSGGTFYGSGVVACCTCGRRVKLDKALSL